MNYLEKSLVGKVLNISLDDFSKIKYRNDLIAFIDYDMYSYESVSSYTSGLYRVKLRCLEQPELALILTLDYSLYGDYYIIKEVYITMRDEYQMNMNESSSLFGSSSTIRLDHNGVMLINIPSLLDQSKLEYGCKQINLKGNTNVIS